MVVGFSIAGEYNLHYIYCATCSMTMYHALHIKTQEGERRLLKYPVFVDFPSNCFIKRLHFLSNWQRDFPPRSMGILEGPTQILGEPFRSRAATWRPCSWVLLLWPLWKYSDNVPLSCLHFSYLTHNDMNTWIKGNEIRWSWAHRYRGGQCHRASIPTFPFLLPSARFIGFYTRFHTIISACLARHDLVPFIQ